jgi:parvulin-like peptidyl-prolyl isomerase
MSELARAYSITPEAEIGGIVDWVARDHLEETMEKALFSLKRGQISPVTKTPYGYHIFKVLAVRSEGVMGLPEVKSEIAAELLSQRHEAFYKKWLAELRARYTIKINEDLLKTL